MESTICQWCKREAHATVMIPLDWINLVEHRGYHEGHVCTARYRGDMMIWAGVETYRSQAHQVEQRND